MKQDSVNAIIYATLTQNSAKADQSTTYTKIEVVALIAAAGGGGGYTDAQIDALLATKGSSQTLSDVISGTQTLADVNISGTLIGEVQSIAMN